MRPAEIRIRGAGPVGCTVALALQGAGLAAVLEERRPARGGAAPLRPIALSYASRLILERVGAWPRLAPTPIETIHVSQSGAFGRARLAAADAAVPALGYVVDYAALAAALTACVAASGIRVSESRADAALVIHAEGASPDAQQKDYQQEAVLALVGTDPEAGSRAFERFTPEGPLALLPFAGRYAVVWSTRPERARELAEAPPGHFLAALSAAFGGRAGKFESLAGRDRVALALRVRASRVGAREAYVGNAAQTLHPVAGQGLNLGLRDAWDLARLLRDADDPGDARVLARYAALRRLDAAATVRVTDLLAGAFLGADPVRRAARGLALTALDACVPLRRFFARRMIFGASAIP